MTYRNVVSAVVRALAAETINSAGGCDFNPKVQCAKQKGEISGKEWSLLQDCIVHKLLHKVLSQRHWFALTAKFSTHNGRKIEATGRLVAIVTSPAPHLFTQKAVTAWAIPQIKGARKEPVKAVAVELDKDTPAWRAEAAKAAVERANASAAKRRTSQQDGPIILADSNYDMTTWDTQGLDDRTYRRWRHSIHKALESLVDNALVEAQLILEEAGVLGEQAA
ncbi:hypothetical protein [Pseudomonas fluorescens]|uniref:hypothetical protein n=1 Tax=Pseudomonas fluorescens TaxID=294 RepID=UPI00165564CB|nr:hypothetical protein [Pseudomonas fluorescens]MBC8786539.1 hypothetical protein [Pseudomonas fluorescens]